MIPGAFAYHRPRSLAEAVALCAAHPDDGRPLAGGHSLVPMMKLRLATPDHLIDLGAIGELRGVRREGEDWIIGATTTQAALIEDAGLAASVPILHETALQIADPQVRACGTLGGNVANGDPGNDMPALMMCLGASYRLAGANGTREVAAREFYRGAYLTALAPGEILTEIRIPSLPAGHGYGYEKLKRKIGDYATAAAAVMLTLAGRRIATVTIGLTNVAPTPLLAADAAAALIGRAPEAAAFAEAARRAEAIADPTEDGRGPADYRRKMAGVMVRRALARAAARAA
ncbi:MAG TPA: xanthine dehydrogenase family protein subunit M [Acetobacteraceae bacterium]|nr:xanthine dehydrogenase family protein subunit M [Acetobacteraceae bacterium]